MVTYHKLVTMFSIYLKRGDVGLEVKLVQSLLKLNGYEQVVIDGEFGPRTEAAVLDFQGKNGLTQDGIVGYLTFSALEQKKLNIPKPSTPGLEITDHFLSEFQYFRSAVPKRQIVLHHTMGIHRPDYTIDSWNGDEKGRIAGAFVIGGIATAPYPEDRSFDGKIYRAFPEHYWAIHLFPNEVHNHYLELESQSIAIKFCNFGYLTRSTDGRYLSYLNREIPESEVCMLPQTYKHSRFYQKYTDSQLESVKKLILSLANQFSIDVHGDYTEKWFEVNPKALHGVPGLWTHASYRKERTDCFPQPELLDMLNSL
ncbi:MAG: peptidoglycan-binding protein [Bacteroidia bacterium]|nr:peptidoglycan-binding protein [Bacteroidia bacterium]